MQRRIGIGGSGVRVDGRTASGSRDAGGARRAAAAVVFFSRTFGTSAISSGTSRQACQSRRRIGSDESCT